MVGAVDATAPWFPAWYERMHSEETVRSMADLGVNLVVTHFFKGFGLEHEREEQQRTAELVQLAHRHGVKVMGYCQSRSLYYEAFLAEQPDAEKWIQRDEHGKCRTWGSSYYRWAPCVLSDEFRQYMKRVIRHGLEEVKLDGLHFDNDYAYPCYCSRCEKGFREWLEKHWPNPRKRFGFASFDHVRQPPTLTSVSRINDPLAQEWVRFRCETLGEYHQDLTSYARSIRPDAILLGNPAHPRSLDAPYQRSVWAPEVGAHLNLMFAENGNFPGMIGDVLVSQIRASRQGDAIGYRVISTTWRHGRGDVSELPEKPEEVSLQIAEAAANGAVPGTNWALRPLGEEDRMQIDRPELRAALRKALAFVRSNEPLIHKAQPIQDVIVLRSFASLAFDNRQAWPLLLGAEEVLIRGGFAWGNVFGERGEFPENSPVLVLAGQSHLSEGERRKIKDFVARGGGVVNAGTNGQQNEKGHQQLAIGTEGLDGAQVIHLPAEAARSAISTKSELRVSLPKNWGEMVAAIEKAAGDRLSVRLRGNGKVALSAWEGGDGTLVVHLVNYATPKPAEGLRLELGSRWKQAKTARLLDLDAAERKVPVEFDGSRGVLALPPLETYAVVVIGGG